MSTDEEWVADQGLSELIVRFLSEKIYYYSLKNILLNVITKAISMSSYSVNEVCISVIKD